MDQIDPAILAEIPVIPAPLGHDPNFTNPETSDKPLAITLPIFMFIILVSTLMRVYTRTMVTHALGVDDCESMPMRYLWRS
jgi:hypothetical protein